MEICGNPREAVVFGGLRPSESFRKTQKKFLDTLMGSSVSNFRTLSVFLQSSNEAHTDRQTDRYTNKFIIIITNARARHVDSIKRGA